MHNRRGNRLAARILVPVLVLAMVISLFEGMNTVSAEAALKEPIIGDPVYIGDGRLEGANTSKNLAVGNDGAIYAVYQGTGSTTNGAVCIRKSMDNGMTFGDEVIVAPNGTECEVAVSSTNRVFVSYHVQTGFDPETGRPITDTCVAYSDDMENEGFTEVKVPEVGVPKTVGVLNEETGMYEPMSIIQYPTKHHLVVNGDYVYVIASDGVNLFISDDGGDTYTLKEISETSMAYTVPMVDKDTGAIMILRDNPRVDYYYNTNADGSGDFTYYKYWALDFDLKEQGVCDVYYSTADYGKYNGKGYLYTSGAFGYIYRIEVGKEMSESSWTKNSSINPNNVIEYPCATYDDVNAPDPDTGRMSDEKAMAYSQIFNGRSVTADYKGNVAVGYVMYSTTSSTGKAYYQVSHDGGETFGDGVEVAAATAANAAINPIVGSLLYMYESNDKVYLVTVENVLDNYSVTANPTTLVFSPEDAGTGIPRKFLITNNTDDELPVPNVIASDGFEVTVGDDSVPAHGTLEVSVVYKDPTVKNGTVTVEYEDEGGNPQELKVKVALSNTIKGAGAAEAKASATSVTVEDIDSETYYALFSVKDGEADTMIHDWVSGAITAADAALIDGIELSGKNLTFTGLDPDTAYVVRAVSKEAYDAEETDNSEYYVDTNVMTAIDTMGEVEGSAYTPEITNDATSITVTGLDPKYTYGLYDSKGNVAEGGSFRAPTDGTVEFTGLTPGKTYYFAAKSEDNPVSETVKVKLPAIPHTHEWSGSLNGSEDVLTMNCVGTAGTCDIGTSAATLTLELDPDKKLSENFLTITSSSKWSLTGVETSGLTIYYEGIDGTEYEKSSTKPGDDKVGTYVATVDVTVPDKESGTKTFTLSKEFALKEDGVIESLSGHTHKWHFEPSGDGTGVIATCIRETPTTCEFFERGIEIFPTIEKGAKADDLGEDGKPEYPSVTAVSLGKYEEIDEETPDPENEAKKLLPTPKKVEFFEVDEDKHIIPGTGTEEAPTEPGEYEMVITYSDTDGTEVSASIGFTIEEDGTVIPEYHYRYPGKGIDRSKGYIMYDVSQRGLLTTDEKIAMLFDPNVFTAFDDEPFKAWPADVRAEKIAAGEKDTSMIDVNVDHSALYNYAMNMSDKNKMDVDGKELYIDMYKETLVNNAGIAIKAYRTTDSGKWVAVEKSEDFSNQLSKIIDKGCTLTVTDGYDAKTKKATGTLYSFTKIAKRPSTPSFKINYVAAADEFGVTNGQFILSQTVSEVADADLATDYEVTFSIDGKNPTSQGWGVWPSTGGVWVPDMLSTDKESATKPADSYTKQGKVVLLIRAKAKGDHLGTKNAQFIPAAKVKKVSVSTMSKALKVKADYNKEIIKLSKDVMAYFGLENEIPNPLVEEVVSDDKVLQTDGTHLNAGSGLSEGEELDSVAGYFATYSITNKSSGISLAGYLSSDAAAKFGTGNEQLIQVWKKAAKSKPATVRQEIRLATRYVVPDSAKSLKVDDKGKVSLKNEDGTVTYQIMSVSNDKVKWGGSLPTGNKLVITPDSEADDEKNGTAQFTVRTKCTAKGGKENNTTFASSEYYTLTIKYEKNEKNKWIAKSATLGEYIAPEPEPTPSPEPTPEPSPEPSPEP